MVETEDPEIRHCAECNENVHLCEKTQDLQLAMINNWCVAMHETEKGTERPTLIGDVEPSYFTDQH
jgi:hypothetical protein